MTKTTAEIKEMIKKYDIKDAGNGKLRCCNMELAKMEMGAIKAAKPEILAYFATERQALADKMAAEEKAFEAIPGIKEIKNIRNAWAAWHKEFNRRMDDELLSCVSKAAPEIKVADVEAKYPEAVFALKVDAERYGANYDIAVIAEKACQSIITGQPISEVKAAYDAEMEAFANRNMWD